jgi:hypothetical protein
MSPSEQAVSIKWIAVGSGFVGMLSAFACILAYLIQRREYSRRLHEQQISLNMPPPRTLRMQELLQGYLTQLMWLNVADALIGFAFVLGIGSDFQGFAGHQGGVSPSILCSVQSLLIATTPLFSAFWTLALAVELWRITFRLEQDLAGNFQRKRYILYQVLCWGAPVCLVLATLFSLGPKSPHRPGAQDTGSWCWLDVKENTTDEGLYDPVWPLYVPKIVVAVLLVALYTAVVCRVRCASQNLNAGQSGSTNPMGKWNTMLFRFAGYPLVFLFTLLPPLLLRTRLGQSEDVHRDTQGGGEEHGTVTYGCLAFLTAILMPAQGTLNLALFAFSNRQVRSALNRICCCRLRHCLASRTSPTGHNMRQSSTFGAQLTWRGRSGGLGRALLAEPRTSLPGHSSASTPVRSPLDQAQEAIAAALLPSDDEEGAGIAWGSGEGCSSDDEQGGHRREQPGKHGHATLSAAGLNAHTRTVSVQYRDAAMGDSFVWEQPGANPQHSWAMHGSGGLQGLPPSLEAAMVAYGRDSADSFDLPLPNTMTDGSVFGSVYEADH